MSATIVSTMLVTANVVLEREKKLDDGLSCCGLLTDIPMLSWASPRLPLPCFELVGLSSINLVLMACCVCRLWLWGLALAHLAFLLSLYGLGGCVGLFGLGFLVWLLLGWDLFPPSFCVPFWGFGGTLVPLF